MNDFAAHLMLLRPIKTSRFWVKKKIFTRNKNDQFIAKH